MQAKAPVVAPLSGPARAFLDFCRVEKGLAANSISSYRTDLKRLISALPVREADATADQLGGYVQSLYNAGMSARSVARHIATLRNFYGFLTREGTIARDPAELLTPPRQWSTLPKYLNREEVERLIAAPPDTKPTGSAGPGHAGNAVRDGTAGERIVRSGAGRSGAATGRAAGAGEGQQASYGSVRPKRGGSDGPVSAGGARQTAAGPGQSARVCDGSRRRP